MEFCGYALRSRFRKLHRALWNTSRPHRDSAIDRKLGQAPPRRLPAARVDYGHRRHLLVQRESDVQPGRKRLRTSHPLFAVGGRRSAICIFCRRRSPLEQLPLFAFGGVLLGSCAREGRRSASSAVARSRPADVVVTRLLDFVVEGEGVEAFDGSHSSSCCVIRCALPNLPRHAPELRHSLLCY